MCERTSVNGRLVCQSVGSRFHKRRHEAQFDAMFLQESIFILFPHLCDVAVAEEHRKKHKTTATKHYNKEQLLALTSSNFERIQTRCLAECSRCSMKAYGDNSSTCDQCTIFQVSEIMFLCEKQTEVEVIYSKNQTKQVIR